MDEFDPGNGDVSEKTTRPKLRAHHVKPAESSGETRRALIPKHVEELRKSALDDDTIERCGAYSLVESAEVARILRWSWRNGGALVFPFRDYDSGAVVLERVKPDSPRTKGEKKKPIKYEQPPGTGAVPYFGPRTISEQRLGDSSHGIVWTEGEKKTLALDQLGYAAIGLTGCHNFSDAAQREKEGVVAWSTHLAKYSARFVAGRDHTICFDSDAIENEHVMLAARRLAGLLLASGARSVRFAKIPGNPEKRGEHVGVDDLLLSRGESGTREIIDGAALVGVGEEVEPIAPSDPLVKLGSIRWVRAAELAEDLRLPPRYDVRRDRSVWFTPPGDDGGDGDPVEVMRAATFISRVMDDHAAIDGGGQRAEIVYWARESWHRATVERKSLRDTRRAIADLPPEVAIDSINAAGVVRWIGEQLRANERRLPVVRFSQRMGWHTVDGRDEFLAGARARSIVFDGAPEIGAALSTSGDPGAQLDALRSAYAADPLCALAITAALAAPLVRIVGAPNFAINLYGDSSRGKTSIAQIAASVYGDPRNPQWVGSWNATAVSVELRAATLCDLPLFFDEVGAGERGAAERTLYWLVNGLGKSRGDKTLQARAVASWHTIVISTGERELGGEDAATGAQVRAIQLRVNGVGELDGAGVDALRKECSRNCGHLGHAWIEALQSRVSHDELRRRYGEASAWYRSQAADPLAARQSAHFALLAVTEHYASQLIGIGAEVGATMRALFRDAEGRRVVVASAADRALEIVREWVTREPTSFPWLVPAATGGLTLRAEVGARRVDGVRHDGCVWFVPGALRERLADAGISFLAIGTEWRERGVLEADGDGRLTKKIQYDDGRPRMICVRSARGEGADG